MGFSENLKRLRSECHLSQEEFAELFEVSRQAVSKWEQGLGYPEVDKLLQISKKLNVSLDNLMYGDGSDSSPKEVVNMPATGEIVIRSPYENVIVKCSRVMTSGRMGGGEHSPHYALFCSDSEPSFWGQSTFLGWYSTYEEISKEVEEIYSAILRGEPAYTLQLSVKTERRGLSVRMVP